MLCSWCHGLSIALCHAGTVQAGPKPPPRYCTDEVYPQLLQGEEKPFLLDWVLPDTIHNPILYFSPFSLLRGLYSQPHRCATLWMQPPCAWFCPIPTSRVHQSILLSTSEGITAYRRLVSRPLPEVTSPNAASADSSPTNSADFL